MLGYALSQTINLSVKLFVFHREYKIAKLKPLIKWGYTTNPKNYRAISLLSLVPKITEKLIHYQLQGYLKENGLLYKYQLGFRANFSANSFLVQITNFVLIDMNQGMWHDFNKTSEHFWHTGPQNVFGKEDMSSFQGTSN